MFRANGASTPWSADRRRLDVDRREVEPVRTLERRERDREILDREPGRVEDGDLLVALPADRVARENRAERP